MHLTDLEPWVCTWCHLTHACSHFYINVVLSFIYTQCISQLGSFMGWTHWAISPSSHLEPWVCTWCYPTHGFSHFYINVLLSFIYTQCISQLGSFMGWTHWAISPSSHLEPSVCTWCHPTHVCSHFYKNVVSPWTLSMYVMSSNPCMFTFLQQCSVILYTHTMHLTDLEPWVCTWCHPTHGFSHFYNDVVLSSIYTQCTWLTLNPEYVRDVIWPMHVHISTTM